MPDLWSLSISLSGKSRFCGCRLGKSRSTMPQTNSTCEIPLARFVNAHYVDDLRAIVGNLQNRAIDCGGGDTPEFFQ